MILSGADILVKTLIEQGVDVVFGYPGGQILDVYDSLYKYQSEIKHILTAHEQGAAHAADGYSRSTGRVGVVISTSGPGATNLVTGIATAHLDSIPLVAICGNVPSNQIGSDSFQEIDITGITLPITKHNYFVGSVEQLADTVREAFKLAVSGRPGPVLIDIPKDVQIAMCEYEPKEKVERDEPIAAKDIRIEEAANIINSAKRPFIYFGGGVCSSMAQEEMIELAEVTDAFMGCSMMGLSAIPTNQARFLGMHGMHGHYASTVSMNNADVVIALGVRFNDRATGNKDKFARNSEIIHIDVDGSELSKNVNEAVGLRGDIKKTLQKLLPLLNKKENPAWHAFVEKLIDKEIENSDTRDGMTPKNILMVVNENIGDNTPVCTDVGQHQMWTAQNINLKRSKRFISSGGLGTMGFGLGAAIGATFGTGENSLLITSDGSFGMSLHELATAVTYNLPVVILILNNRVLGMVHQWQKMFFAERYSNSVLNRQTDFAKVAKAFGADGERVESLEELDKALKKGFSLGSPYVIDCKVSSEELVLPMMPPGGSMDDIITEIGDYFE